MPITSEIVVQQEIDTVEQYITDTHKGKVLQHYNKTLMEQTYYESIIIFLRCRRIVRKFMYLPNKQANNITAPSASRHLFTMYECY